MYLYGGPTSVIKKPAKPECPYDLNGISRDDVIEFFKHNEGLKEHWQKIMDQDKYKSEFKRHIVALTTRDVGPHSAIRQNTNIAFLRQKTWEKIRQKYWPNVEKPLFVENFFFKNSTNLSPVHLLIWLIQKRLIFEKFWKLVILWKFFEKLAKNWSNSPNFLLKYLEKHWKFWWKSTNFPFFKEK